LKPRAAINRISSAISVFNSCFLQSPIRGIYQRVPEEIDNGSFAGLRGRIRNAEFLRTTAGPEPLNPARFEMDSLSHELH
jgi:hypothetical protein